jgi:tripartite ATP-independent transporter DctM subunit
LAEKLKSTAQSMIPVAVIMFMVLGTIFLGVATPTEAASLGTLGAFLLTVAYRKCSKEMLRKSIMGTVKLTGTIMFIVAGAAGFSQLLSLTGTTRALLNLVTGLAVEPVMMVIVMMVIVFILGMFLEQIPIMMITLPVFIPVIMALDVDPIWFGIIMLINMHIGTYSPPFGLVLFVMKGVAPAGTAMLDIYKSAIPFIMLDILAIIILFIFPDIVTFLPRLMSDG